MTELTPENQEVSMEGGIYMTEQEKNRADLFSQISQKIISQTEAAKQLGLSIRDVQRLYALYRKIGLKALVSRHRGRPINHQLPAFLKARIRELVTCDQFLWDNFMTAPIEKPKVGYFDHDKWDVYQASLELVILISDVVEHLPRGKAYLADQLQRAGTSVPLNIAEGAGEDSLSEKARFYRMAKRSASSFLIIRKKRNLSSPK